MKKILCFKLVLCLVLLYNLRGVEVEASDHLAYQSMDIYGGQLLQRYTDEEIDSYVDEIEGRKFFGWEINELAVAAKSYFVSHTIFSYYNTGTTKIDYTWETVITTTTKVSYSASGQIKYSLSGTKSGFKHGLDTTLKLEYDNDNTVVEKETVKISFSCDPNTRILMYMAGEGYLYNGAAQKYNFWIKGNSGGYEYFITSTTYQVLEKVAL